MNSSELLLSSEDVLSFWKTKHQQKFIVALYSLEERQTTIIP